MNYSKQRDIILKVLKENVVHPTAEYLYGILEEKKSGISLATLYRNLNQLADKGIIKKIEGLETSSHFDHNTHEHFHFICDKCKKIFDIPLEVAPDVVQKTEEKTGFTVKGYDIAIHGVCSACKEKGENDMEKYICTVCNYVYDPEENDGVKFEDLPEDYTCPICNVGKDLFEKE